VLNITFQYFFLVFPVESNAGMQGSNAFNKKEKEWKSEMMLFRKLCQIHRKFPLQNNFEICLSTHINLPRLFDKFAYAKMQPCFVLVKIR